MLEANQSAIESLGYSRKSLMSMTMMDFENGLTGENFSNRIKRLRQGASILFETLQLKANGKSIPVETNCQLIEYRGETALLVIARDISERKQAEAEREIFQERLKKAEKMESLGIMAAGIAHDLNNILYPILGYTEMALDQASENENICKYLETALEAALRGKDMVHGILAFGRKSEGKKIPSAIPQIVREVLGLLKSMLPKTVALKVHLPDIPRAVLADPTQIHQIVMNLCINACHAMTEQEGVLTVEASEVAISASDAKMPMLAPGAYISLSVRDTGHGIPPEVMNKIFDPYFTTKPKDEGTGMGLATVYGIVKDHGGDIHVESAPGSGACFSVYLPLLAGGAEMES